ncbi:peptidoglycan-binding protein [Streptomyces sp. FL07-04A]|uniref:peptidoglycan-binding protein n=1 Tax=Streptomyces sp. FL07-04A TaxID=3028658 RepID=UPI0029B10441|nr:peptidoglycan-binding protein [Streptomyces sp. FL07-04A]MDX3576209.1 peptidoglycan-binding protein [Streptomyces sp. FL07-04A]
MEPPAFEEFDPGGDCECPGCAVRRRAARNAPTGPFSGFPSAHRALVVATATAAALGAVHAAPAAAAPQAPDRPGVPAGDEPKTPQGVRAPLHGPAGRPARPGGAAGPVVTPATTRADIIRRAKEWVSAQVPYSMSAYWWDGYRQDCSGFVSMAWNLPRNEWTGSLHQFGTRISKDELQPGDILLFHNPSDPEKGSHVVLFGGWTDYTHTYYVVYEQTRPTTRRQATPYAYWSHSDRYVPYRYKGLGPAGQTAAQAAREQSGSTGGAPGAEADGDKPGGQHAALPAFPGRAAFGPGADNGYVTLLGRLLVERGAGRFYASGPGPRWSAADGRATRAFQRAQGWSGDDADGLPGPRTWALLVSGRGRDVEGRQAPQVPKHPQVPHVPHVPHVPQVPKAPGSPGSGASPGAAGGSEAGAEAGSGAGPGSGAQPGVGGLPAAPVPSAPRVPAYPGRGVFRPGVQSAYVTQLGRQLVKKGFGRHYATGPGPRWGEADRRAVEAFQRAQGWRGGAADGYPGPETWRRLFF